jgi:hypothetical protein
MASTGSLLAAKRRRAAFSVAHVSSRYAGSCVYLDANAYRFSAGKTRGNTTD